MQTRLRARVFLLVLVYSALFLLLLAVISIAIDPGFETLILFLFLVFEFGVIVLWQRRDLDFAAHVFVFGAWAFVTAGVFFTGGIMSATTVAQVMVVIAAALLTSSVVTYGILTATAALNGILVMLALYGGESGLTADDPLVFRFTLHLVVMLLAATTLLQSVRATRNVFQNLANSEHKFRALFEKSTDVLFLIGLDTAIIEANANASKILGYEPQEFTGMRYADLVPPEERAELKRRFDRARSGEVLDYVQRRLVTKDGDQVVMEASLAMVRGENGKVMHFQSTARDITAKINQDRLIQSTLAHMAVRATTDYLTGTLNRDAVLEHAEAEWARHLREGSPMSVLMIDMDRLKFINDTFGHGYGDQALKRLAETLEQNKRPYDWLGRYGGDEFLLVLPGTTFSIAREIAHRLQRAVALKKISVDDEEIVLSCSIGAASTSQVPNASARLRDLIKAADTALYTNKARNNESL